MAEVDFLTSINLKGNTLKNAGFEVLTALPTTDNFVGRQIFYNNKPYFWTGSTWVTFNEEDCSGEFWALYEANPEVLDCIISISNSSESVFPIMYKKYKSYLYSRNIYVDLSSFSDTILYINDVFGDIKSVPEGVRYHIYLSGINDNLKIDFPIDYNTNWTLTHINLSGIECFTIPYAKCVKIEFIKLSDSNIWVDVENYGGMPGYSTATATNSEESTNNIVNYCDNNNIEINYNKETGNAIFNLVDILSSITTKLK